MADDDTMADDTVPDGVAAEGAPVGERGECPICGAEFDDPEAFRDHLGEVHELYDEEGATTTALWIPTFAVEPAADVEPTIPETPAPEPAAAREKAPVGLIVLVLLLIVFGGGLVLYIQSDDGPDTAADSPLVATGPSSGATTASGGGGTTDTASTPGSTSSPTGGTTDGITPSGEQTTSTSGTSSGTVPVTEPPPPSSTTTVTTAPPVNFVAPTTTAAKVDNCTRDHGRWIVTYSWRYVGGTGWSPLAAYTATGGGRYRHTVSLPSNGNTPITTVGVLDSNGTQHNVALSPTLSANNC